MGSSEPSTDAPRAAQDPPTKAPVGFDPFELSRLRSEIRLYRLLAEINTQLREARDVDSIVRFVVRACAEFYGTDEVCIAAGAPPFDQVSVLFSTSTRIEFAAPLLRDIIRGGKVELPPELTFSRIRRRDRAWGVLMMRRAERFSQSERRALARITSATSALLREVDLRRMVEVRERIDRKSMEQIRPIDLAYHILDALRSLTRYDHSSAVLMKDASDGSLQIIAEQIAWRKGESKRIHQRFVPSPAVQQALDAGDVYCFTREPDGWSELARRGADELAALLDFNRPDSPEEPREMQILCAPLRGRDGILGLLKVSCCHAGGLGTYEAGLLAAFLPQATLALHNAQRTESLQTKMIAAERKHAMADLARGVSHDLNNALGAVLPLVQQLCDEASSGALDPKTCSDDLKQIERSLHTCRRIFSGMLTFARRAAAAIGEGSVRQAVEGTLAILEDGMRRRGIDVTIDVPENLPSVTAAQSDLEQLMLNLVTNARDAMPDGGRLGIAARHESPQILIRVEDTGCGIAPDVLPRVHEPFFTTKPNGSGLGLSICRSIVWDLGGEMRFESRAGEGTRVTLMLPAVESSASSSSGES